MSTMVESYHGAQSQSATSETTLSSLTGALLLAQFAIFLVALVTLGRAINWPASLDQPASVVLPLIREQRGPVALGYTSYLLSALLLVPIALLLRRVLDTGMGALFGSVLAVSAAIGAAAGVLKILGIVRWLVVMPFLADSYVDPAASATARETVMIVYNALNKYAGGIGEMLGVVLFSGVWTLLVAVVLLRSTTLPRWLGWFGLVAGVVVTAGFVEVFGVTIDGLYLTVSGVIWQLWMIALGVALLRTRTAAQRRVSAHA